MEKNEKGIRKEGRKGGEEMNSWSNNFSLTRAESWGQV
jgi:hypothetical protein